jgi:hypothetical protein
MNIRYAELTDLSSMRPSKQTSMYRETPEAIVNGTGFITVRMQRRQK